MITSLCCCLPGKIVCLQCIMLHVLCAYLNERGLFTTHPEGGIVGDSNGQLSLGMAIGDSRVWWVRLHAFMWMQFGRSFKYFMSKWSLKEGLLWGGVLCLPCTVRWSICFQRTQLGVGALVVGAAGGPCVLMCWCAGSLSVSSRLCSCRLSVLYVRDYLPCWGGLSVLSLEWGYEQHQVIRGGDPYS